MVNKCIGGKKNPNIINAIISSPMEFRTGDLSNYLPFYRVDREPFSIDKGIAGFFLTSWDVILVK